MDLLDCYTKLIFLLSTKLLMISTQEYCTDPKYIPSNGSRKPSEFLPKYMNGAVLRYSCDDTYMLVPPISLQICKTNIWIPIEHPECQKICDGLEHVPYSYHVPLLDQYPVGSVVSYSCRDDRVLIGGTTRTCLSDRTWTGNPPRCEPDPLPTVDHPYCTWPPSIENGVIFCCDSEDSSSNCCPPTDHVQFECNLGYKLVGTPEWTCGDDGMWLDSRLPTCEPDEEPVSPHTDPPLLSIGMIHTMIGVAAGILGLLVIVMVLAFCKPRLRDIKRRWRDLREDENELIVNGQRIVLPTYEEVTSCPEYSCFDFYNQIQGPSAPRLNALSSSEQAASLQTDNITRPPESNITVDDLTRNGARSNVNSQADLEFRNDSGHNTIAGSQDQDGCLSDGVTITEFLRENPAIDQIHCDVMTGFEDNFVPVPEVSDGQSLQQATSSDSPNSDEVVSASLGCAALFPQRDPETDADVSVPDNATAQVADTLPGIDVDSSAGDNQPTEHTLPSDDALTQDITSTLTCNQLITTDVVYAESGTEHTNQCENATLHTGSTSV